MVGVRQFDEERVLSDALAVFWRKGLRATSMLDLAEATGVQRGSLYNAYGDKEELFLLAFDRYAKRFLETARKSLRGEDVESTLRTFLNTMIANMTDGVPPRGCLTTKTANETDLIGDAVSDKVRDLLDELEAVLADGFARHADELNLPPGDAANLVVTFTRGLAVMERVHHDASRLRKTADLLVKSLVAADRRENPASYSTPPADPISAGR